MALTRFQLEQMKEDDLRKEILIPLFKKMGYQDVYEYHGGSLEQGKDIVMWRPDEFGQRVNYAVVVKAKKISGSVSARSGAGEVLTQIQQAFGSPFKNPVTSGDEYAQRCLVVCPTIRPEALTALNGALKEQHLDRVTRFLHDDNLWAAIEEYVPAKTVIAKLGEAGEFLDQVSDRFRIKAEVGEKVTLTLEERESGNSGEPPLEVSVSFEFPDTPEGRKVAESVQKAFSTGSPATVPQEFVRELRLPNEMKTLASLFGLAEDVRPAIEMKSLPSEIPMPLRLEVCKDGELTGLYEYIDLRVTQSGTDEVTLTNEHQLVPLKLQMVISRRDRELRQTWKVEIKDANVHEVLQALKFHNAVAAGGTLRAVHLQTGLLIVERAIGPGEAGIEGSDPFWLEVLEELDFIQQKIEIPIRLPGRDISTDEAWEILETARILRDGRLESESAGWTLGVEKGFLDEHFSRFHPGLPHCMAIKQDEEREILGVRFDMGERIVSCARAYVSKAEAKRAKAAARRLGDNDSVHITFKPFDKCPVIVEYPKWLPEGDGPVHTFHDTEEPQLPDEGDQQDGVE